MGLSKNPIMPSADKFPHYTIMPLAEQFPHCTIMPLADKSDKRVTPLGSFIFAIKKERLSF
jgi:hypothetical protein